MNQLTCGFSQIDITPAQPKEVYLDGYGHRILPAEGVRDPIYAKIMAVSGGEDFYLVSMDICGLGRELKDHLCRMISTLTGISRQQFALCATHTHAGPACGVLERLPINWLYWNHVAEKIAVGMQLAKEKACTGSFRFAKGGDFESPLNRRGKEVINRNVWVAGFYDNSQQLKGVIASASCHAVCNTEYTISADFPGVLTTKGNEKYPGVPFLYLQNRGADINPPCGGEEGLELVGNELTKLVFGLVNQLPQSQPVTGEVTSAFCQIDLPLCYPSLEDVIEKLQEFKNQVLATKEDVGARRYPEVEMNWYAKALEEIQKNGNQTSLPIDLQVLCLGKQAVFVFAPFEVLTVTGNAMEEQLMALGFSSEQIIVVGYANGTNSYLCPEAESGEYGYETRLASHWYNIPECTAQSEPVVIETLIKLAKSLL